MEFIYGQDCGDYDITFTPPLDLLSLSSIGINLSPQGQPFVDTLTLTSTSVDDIGVYNLQLNIVQDINNAEHGYTQPERGVVETASYPFLVTVLPCVMSSYDIVD